MPEVADEPKTDALAGAMNEMTAPDPTPDSEEGLIDHLMRRMSEPDEPVAPAKEEAPKTEAKPKEEPKTEPKAEESEDDIPDIEIPGKEKDGDKEFPSAEEAGLEGKAAAKWGELRNELAELKAWKREQEAKAATKEANNVAPEVEKQLTELQAKVKKYEEEQAVYRVEKSEEYERLVIKPVQKIESAAQEIAETYNVDVSKLTNALGESNRKRQIELLEDITSDMRDGDRLDLYRMAQDMRDIYRKDEELRENAASAMAELEERQAAEAERAKKQDIMAVRSSVENVFKMFEERIPNLPDTVDLEALKSEALESDFASASAEVRGYSISAGRILPEVVKAYKAIIAENKALKKEVESFTAMTPNAGQGSKVEGDTDDSEMGLLDILEKRLAGG